MEMKVQTARTVRARPIRRTQREPDSGLVTIKGEMNSVPYFPLSLTSPYFPLILLTSPYLAKGLKILWWVSLWKNQVPSTKFQDHGLAAIV
jgi:hypothetical protein